MAALVRIFANRPCINCVYVDQSQAEEKCHAVLWNHC